jgi:hypothetical protein
MSEQPHTPAELPLLREMGEELHRLFLAEEHASTAPRARGISRLRVRPGAVRLHLRLVLALVVLLLAAAAAALAAGGLLSGSPVKPRFHVQPRVFDGAPLATSATLLALSVPDPGGGLPWGLRMVHTTRGLGCLQYGRLYGGRLGVLGQDGAFGDDQRFHPLSLADAVTGTDACGPLDAKGRLSLASQSQAMPASADPEACLPRVDYQRGMRMPGRLAPPRGTTLCPAADERALFFGALGPDVQSISYSLQTRREVVREMGRAGNLTITRSVYALQGPTVTVPTVGSQGAYLIIARALSEAQSGTFGPGAPNGSATLPYGQYQPIRAITYKDGSVCHIGATQDLDGHGRPCAPIGMLAPARPTGAQVRAPLNATILYERRDPPLRPEDVVRVQFTARAPITTAANYYEALMRDPCRGASGGSALDEDIAAGQRVTFYLQMSNGPPGSKPCPGVYSGEVLYGNRSTQGLARGGGIPVGYFSVRLR